MNVNNNLCQNCWKRPKFNDGTRTHNYCSKTCAGAAAGAASGNSLAVQQFQPSMTSLSPTATTDGTGYGLHQLCNFCGERPKFVERGFMHDFCGKTCARSAQFMEMLNSMSLTSSTAGTPATDSRRDSFPLQPSGLRYAKSTVGLRPPPMFSPPGPPTPPKLPVLSKADKCKFDWCPQPAYVGPKGKGQYCSIVHRNLAPKICLICLRVEKKKYSHFCGATCSRAAQSGAPKIIEVPFGHITFTSVADQFKISWRHATKCPPVKRVYKIMFSQSFMSKYDIYRTSVETQGQFVAKGRTAGNENRRWHGTTRACLLGDNGDTTFCQESTCALCSIIRNSFDISRFGAKTGWGRFGAGIYTSSTSSKSNDYSKNVKNSALKAMLLNKVVVGKGHKLTQDSSSLTGPPAGYNSVLAEVGGSLNYDELIVYTNDAVRPSFLVLYQP